MKKTIKIMGPLLFFVWLWNAGALPCHAQLISIGILPFQDESDTKAPPELLQKIRQEFKQKLTLSYKDVLARLINSEARRAPADANVRQLAALGKQQGAKFVLRGGILAVVSERTGQDLKCHLELFSELVDTDSGSVSGLRAEGEATESNSPLEDARRWDSYTWNSPEFARSALGQALNAAVVSLADQVHAAAISPAPPAQAQTQPVQAQPPVTAAATADQSQAPAASVSPPPSDPTQADQELQQLIAQAESLISSGASANLDTTPLRQCLESLRASINNKLNLMQQGQDTAAVDQEIAQHKQELQDLVNSYTQQAATNPAQPAGEQPQSGGTPDSVSRLNNLMESTLSLIQRVQEVRAALGNSGQAQEAVSSQTPDTGAGESAPPTEEQTSTVSGVVTDNGTPVEGATVTDPQTGISATTDSNGSYTLPNLPGGRIVNLQVVRSGQTIASSRIEMRPDQAGISDWTLKSGVSGFRPTASPIMPSTLIVASPSGQADTGSIQGTVRDDQGRPVSLALVSVKGVGMVRTDSQGRYMLANVPAGNYQVTVQQSRAQGQTQQVKVNGHQTAQAQMLYKNKSTSSGMPVHIQVLAPGTNTLLQGRVADETDQGLGGAKITVVYSGGALSVYSNSTGVYQMRSLKQGDYRVLVSKPGYYETHQNVSLQANVPASRNFRLRKSSSPYVQQALANQQLKPASSTLPLASNHPTSGSKPVVTSSSPSANAGGRNASDQKAKPGSSQTSPKILEKPRSSSAPAQTKFTHVASPAQVAAGSGQVHGVVTDSKTKAPVSGATVSLKGKPSTQTDGSGQYSFSDVAPGSCAVIVKKTGYMSGGGSVTIKSGQIAAANFMLTPEEPAKKAPTSVHPIKKYHN